MSEENDKKQKPSPASAASADRFSDGSLKFRMDIVLHQTCQSFQRAVTVQSGQKRIDADKCKQHDRY